MELRSWESWGAVPDQPTATRPTDMALGGDGTLYVAYGSDPGPSRMEDGGVWKLDTLSGEWMDITPERPTPDTGAGFGYAAIELDPSTPEWILASTFGRPGGEALYRGTDGAAPGAGSSTATVRRGMRRGFVGRAARGQRPEYDGAEDPRGPTATPGHDSDHDPLPDAPYLRP